VGFVAGHLALKAWFFSAHYASIAYPLFAATKGLVSPVSLAAAVEMAVLVGGVMLVLGRLGWHDLGLRRGAAVRAVLVLLPLWALVNVATVTHGLAAPCCPLTENPAFQLAKPLALGQLLDAFWGSGFIEEVMYRGFLLPQVYLLARRLGASKGAALAAALVGTQLYFGLNHIPAAGRMHLGWGEGALYIVHATLVGGMFAALYLQTGNLFVAVGAHALINHPAVVYTTSTDPALLTLIGVCALMLGWPAIARRFGGLLHPPAPALVTAQS